MEKVTLSISPLPPFVAINIDIPVEKIVNGYQRLTEKHIDIANTLNWALEKLLIDQYTEQDLDAIGAWSKRYPEYLDFYYLSEPLASGISVKDTISFSAWIVRPLLSFLSRTNDINLKKVILPRIYYYKDYLLNHYDNREGAFGLARTASGGETQLAIGIRHSAWALLSLIDINEIDNSIDNEVFTKTGEYIFNKLEKYIKTERALTSAALHQVLTNSKAKSLIAFNDMESKRLQKIVENDLVSKYNRSFSSWDFDIKDKHKIKILNALHILISIDINNIAENELSEIVQESIEYLISYLIEIDKNKLALPLVEGENVDLGATIMLFSLLTKNKDLVDKHNKIIQALANYIFDNETLKTDFQYAYPFHLSQVFYYTGSK